jgi:hypothetical protein
MKNIKSQEKLNRGVNEVINAAAANLRNPAWGNGPLHLVDDFMGLVYGVLRDAKMPEHQFNDGEWILLQMWWKSAQLDPSFCCKLGARFVEYDSMLSTHPVYQMGTNPEKWVFTKHAYTGEEVGICFGNPIEMVRARLLRHLTANAHVNRSQSHSLVYDYTGAQKVFTFTASGEDLRKHLVRYVSCMNAELDPYSVRVTASAIVSMWAIQQIDPALRTKEEMNKYPTDCQNAVTKAISGDEKYKSVVESAIGAYLYLIMSVRTEAELGKNTLRVKDFTPNEEYLQQYENTWQDQAHTKRAGIKSFNEFKDSLRGGLKMQILA